MDSYESSVVKPRLRALDFRWIEHEGNALLHLRDPLELSEDSVLVPAPLVPILGLCDGTRDLGALSAALALRTGLTVDRQHLLDLFGSLNSALLLEGPAFDAAKNRALESYRSAAARKPFHADAVYPSDPDDLRNMVSSLCGDVATVAPGHGARLVGMLCPHIDYARGGRTYAQTWHMAAEDLSELEGVIILGTDHMGSPAAVTPTRQRYATPLGSIQTDSQAIDTVVAAVGERQAANDELHHRSEHSIELPSVWLHCFTEPNPPNLVPVLCGSFAGFVREQTNPLDDPSLDAAIDALAEVVSRGNYLVVAAGDLAHMGPTFGDPSPLQAPAKRALEVHDEESLAAICDGDAAKFMSISTAEGDRRRLCGLAPIYIMLETLRRAHGSGISGISMGYDQCPADEDGGSVVSIAGTLLYV